MIQLADLDLTKAYTYADYMEWQFAERVELIRGTIFKMSPAPVTSHQRLSLYISNLLFNFLRDRHCEVFSAPFDVRFPCKSKDDRDIITVLQPDICVVCDPTQIDARGCIGAPDIVVEILSPGNNARELRNKFDIYEESGVREYWIISPENETFLVYMLKDGKFIPGRVMAAGDMFTSVVLPGFKIELEDLFTKALKK